MESYTSVSTVDYWRPWLLNTATSSWYGRARRLVGQGYNPFLIRCQLWVSPDRIKLGWQEPNCIRYPAMNCTNIGECHSGWSATGQISNGKGCHFKCCKIVVRLHSFRQCHHVFSLLFGLRLLHRNLLEIDKRFRDRFEVEKTPFCPDDIGDLRQFITPGTSKELMKRGTPSEPSDSDK